MLRTSILLGCRERDLLLYRRTERRQGGEPSSSVENFREGVIKRLVEVDTAAATGSSSEEEDRIIFLMFSVDCPPVLPGPHTVVYWVSEREGR